MTKKVNIRVGFFVAFSASYAKKGRKQELRNKQHVFNIFNNFNKLQI